MGVRSQRQSFALSSYKILSLILIIRTSNHHSVAELFAANVVPCFRKMENCVSVSFYHQVETVDGDIGLHDILLQIRTIELHKLLKKKKPVGLWLPCAVVTTLALSTELSSSGRG